MDILNSSLSLLKQQRKLEWIKYGGDNAKLFFAKAKQKKLTSYICTLKDDSGQYMEGFKNVARVMMTYYKKLLGTQAIPSTSIDPNIITLGPVLSI